MNAILSAVVPESVCSTCSVQFPLFGNGCFPHGREREREREEREEVLYKRRDNRSSTCVEVFALTFRRQRHRRRLVLAKISKP